MSSELNALTEEVDVDDDDILYLVKAGGSADRKIKAANLLRYIDSVASVYNIKSYGAVGDGVADDSGAFQDAIDACSAAGGGTVYAPAGTFKLLSTVVPASGVDIIGAGWSTVFKPTGSARGITWLGVDDSDYLEDVTFAHFAVDGSAQTNGGSYDVYQSGVRVVFGRRIHQHHLYIHDTAATGLTCDFPFECFQTDCLIDGCGRLNNGTTDGGGSGIGNGTAYDSGMVDNRITVKGCIAINNQRYGIFFEGQSAALSRGISVIGCYAYNNENGFGDSGGIGAVWSGCGAQDNDECGFSIDAGSIPSLVGTIVGARGRIIGCYSAGNGEHGYRINQDVNPGAGRYSISSSRAYNNTLNGIRIDVGDEVGSTVAGFSIVDCDVHQNFGSGIAIENPSGNSTQTLKHVDILNCRVWDNDAGNSGTFGIHVGYSVEGLRIQGCHIYDEGGDQNYAIKVDAGVTLTDCDVRLNDFRGNVTAAQSQAGTLAGTSVWMDNLGADDLTRGTVHLSATALTDYPIYSQVARTVDTWDGSAGPSNTTTETSLVTFALPSNIAAEEVFELDVWGNAFNASGSSRTLQFFVRLGGAVGPPPTGTAVITMDAISYANQAAAGRFKLRVVLTPVVLASSQHVSLEAFVTGGVTNDGAAGVVTGFGNKKATVDLTNAANQSIWVSCKLSAADPNLAVAAKGATLTRSPLGAV